MLIDMADLVRAEWRCRTEPQDVGSLPSPDRGGDPKCTHLPAEIHSDGENLVWNWQERYRSSGPHTNRMLSAFLKLSTASDTAIVAFARRYGVLGAINKGFVPASIPFNEEYWRIAQGTGEMILHRDDFTKRRCPDPDYREGFSFFYLSGYGIMEVEQDTCPRFLSEPLQLWRELSQNAAAILRIAAELNLTPPLPGKPEDWRSLWVPKRLMDMGGHIQGPYWAAISRVSDARHLLQNEINDWLNIGGASIRLFDGGAAFGNRWQTAIRLGFGQGEFRLFGSLALQLMLAVLGTEKIYNCDGCGLPYLRSWKTPNPGCKNYCSNCGTECARRDANYRRKQKMINARRLAREGFGAAEIAEKLDPRPACIRRWIKKR